MLSGSGGGMINIHDHFLRHQLPGSLALVIASRECPGAARARERGIATLVLPGTIPRDTLDRALRDHGITHLALAGYLKLLELPARFVGRALNIHPALLPSFGGAGMYGVRVHQAVLRAGCKVSGCTVHFVDDTYDTGAIVVQRTCPVLHDDTAETLAKRVYAQELIAYPEALGALLRGELRGAQAITQSEHAAPAHTPAARAPGARL